MHRPLHAAAIVRTPQRLAIDCDLRQAQTLGEQLHSGTKRRVERLRLELTDHATDRVVRRDAILLPQMLPQPDIFLSAKLLDVFPTFGPGDDRTDRQAEDIRQRVQSRALEARILKSARPSTITRRHASTSMKDQAPFVPRKTIRC